MFDAQFIQKIKKHLLGYDASLEHADTSQKQTMVETLSCVEATSAVWSQPVSEEQMLTHLGFTEEEALTLLWWRQWYQNGGSDRVVIIRHLEFLKRLVRNGILEP